MRSLDIELPRYLVVRLGGLRRDCKIVVSHFLLVNNAVDILVPGVESIVAVLVDNIKPYSNAARQSNSQTTYVDHRICFILRKVSPTEFEIAFVHSRRI